MLDEPIDDPGETSPAAVRERYAEALADVVAATGVDAAADAADLDRERVAAIREGDAADLTLSAAAAILALEPDSPGAEAIARGARDALLLEMSGAVLDVDALAAGLDGDLEPRDLQAKIEGRQPTTLREFARIRWYVADRRRS